MLGGPPNWLADRRDGPLKGWARAVRTTPCMHPTAALACTRSSLLAEAANLPGLKGVACAAQAGGRRVEPPAKRFGGRETVRNLAAHSAHKGTQTIPLCKARPASHVPWEFPMGYIGERRHSPYVSVAS